MPPSPTPADPTQPPAPAPPKPTLFSPRTLLPVGLALMALAIWLAHSHTSFNWRSLAHQLRFVSPLYILIAFACTYLGYWLRAWRWSVLLSPLCKTSALQMLPSQLIGFTIVGLFGRFADLARPYLIARRLKTSVATQLAVYSIERAFDLAAAAILFSTTLAFAPRNMPHHEAFARAGAISLAATVFLAAFALALRFAGHRVAALATRLLRPLSDKFAHAAAARILEFSQGLRIVSTLSEFLSALVLSVGMWLVIAIMYLCCAHSFRAAPSLATLSFAATMLLLATSLGGSLLQLPILGWFTQIAVLAAALHGFFAVPLETASACGAVLLLASNLAVIPAGLIAARIEGITLRDAASTPAT
jgi:glycosyltransferase 2 family protein